MELRMAFGDSDYTICNICGHFPEERYIGVDDREKLFNIEILKMSVFGNIKARLIQSIGLFGEKSKEAWNVANLKAQIWMLKRQKNRLMFELGKIVYDSYMQNIEENSAINLKIAEIKEMDEEIEHCQESIEMVISTAKGIIARHLSQEEIICSCGATIEYGTRFCGICGKNVAEFLKQLEKGREIPTKASSKFCGICGNPREEDHVYCSQCGQHYD